MISKKSWEEFRKSGLLWWVNMVLHTFGWAIVFDMEGDEVLEVYPARVKFRGFDERSNTEGYQNVSRFLKENAEQLQRESLE